MPSPRVRATDHISFQGQRGDKGMKEERKVEGKTKCAQQIYRLKYAKEIHELAREKNRQFVIGKKRVL